MRITGLLLAMLDVPKEYTEEYNRWYDLDHLPEHVSKADVVAGRRYVADRSLRRARGVKASASTGGHPPYLTTYLFGGPLDFASEQAMDGWRAKDRTIVKAGRFWREGAPRHASRWRLDRSAARPSVLVDEEAIPHLPHRGIVVALGRAPTGRVNEAVEWWDSVHLVDLFAVPGVLAALRFTPVDTAEDGMLLHLLLCDDAPSEVAPAIADAMRYQRAVGRFPAHGGRYESVAFLPYARIVPFDYDFDIGEPDDDSPLAD